MSGQYYQSKTLPIHPSFDSTDMAYRLPDTSDTAYSDQGRPLAGLALQQGVWGLTKKEVNRVVCERVPSGGDIQIGRSEKEETMESTMARDDFKGSEQYEMQIPEEEKSLGHSRNCKKGQCSQSVVGKWESGKKWL